MPVDAETAVGPEAVRAAGIVIAAALAAAAILAPTARGRAWAMLGALALTEVGEGIVIRVGLPEWGVRLKAGSAPVQQLTRNIADILRGTTPAIRTF